MSEIYCTKCGGKNFKYQCVSCADTNPSVEMTNSEIKKDEQGPKWQMYDNDRFTATTKAIVEMYAEDYGYTRTPEPTKADTRISPHKLYEMAKGDSEKYKELMIIHGHLKSLTKAENGLVPLDERKIYDIIEFELISHRSYLTQTFPPTASQYQKAARILSKAICSTFAAPSITKEKDKLECGVLPSWRELATSIRNWASLPIHNDNGKRLLNTWADAIIYKSNITKEQLLAILPDRKIKRHVNCDCEDGEGCRYYSDDPIDIECDKLRDLIEQRIEELFK